MINGVADKIQPCDAKTFFIDRVVIKRIIPLHIGHADDSVTGAEGIAPAQGERIAARGDGHFVAIGKLIIQIAAEVKIVRKKGRCRTHRKPPLKNLCSLYHIIHKRNIEYIMKNGSVRLERRAAKQKRSAYRP